MRDNLAADRKLRDRTYDRNLEMTKNFIVKQLGQMRRQEDVATDVALKYAMDYSMAQQLVRQVAKDHAGSVHMRRVPIIALISVTTLLAGLAFTYASGGAILRFLSGSFLSISWTTIGSFATGVGMIIGSLLGFFSILKPTNPS